MIASNSWLWLWRYGKQRLYTIWFTLQPFLLLLSPNAPTLWVSSHFPTFLLSFLLLTLIELCCLSLEAFWLPGLLLSLERKSLCFHVYQFSNESLLRFWICICIVFSDAKAALVGDLRLKSSFFFYHMHMSHDNLIDQVTLVMIGNLKIYQ